MKTKWICFVLLTIGILLISRCKKSEKTSSIPAPSSTPTSSSAVKTGTVNVESDSSVTFNGTVSSQAGNVIEMGFCWDTKPTPTLQKMHRADTYVYEGPFSFGVDSLKSNTLYYVRAYVTTANGTIYGNDESFKTLPDWEPLLSGLPQGHTCLGVLAVGSTILSAWSDGSLYKSTDNGNTWLTVSIFATSNKEINCFAYADNTLFAGTRAGIYKSYDLGNSWLSTGLGLVYENVKQLLYTDEVLYAGTSSGLFISKDIGSTWNKVNAVGNVQPDFLTMGGNTIYTCKRDINTGQTLYRSTDKGVTWISFGGQIGFAGNVVADLAISGTRLFVGTANGIYQSDDNGASWTYLWIGSHIGYIKSTANLVYALGSIGVSYFYFSNTYGNSFIQLKSPKGLINYSPCMLDANTQYIFSGTSSGLCRLPIQ